MFPRLESQHAAKHSGASADSCRVPELTLESSSIKQPAPGHAPYGRAITEEREIARHEVREKTMDGDLSTWWMVLGALMVVLTLPTGAKEPQRHVRRTR